jgi:hypothetical protein
MDEAPTRGLVVDVLQARDVWLTLDADLTRSYMQKDSPLGLETISKVIRTH